MAKHPCFYGHLLLLPDYCQTLLGFLRSTRKQKLPISFGNQEFTANCFLPPGIEPGTQGFSVLCSTN